jgi:hypothetical protein
LGELKDTIGEFVEKRLHASQPIGYVVLDVDYYSSSLQALKIFNGPAASYLPLTVLYLDDIGEDHHNPYAGESLAINEFNAANEFRKTCRHDFFESSRIFRRATWLKHIFYLHVMDHPFRSSSPREVSPRVLANPLL